MARVDGKFITGKIGPTVYKKYRNKQVIQQTPVFTPSSHTEPSKITAKIFGKASTLARILRDNLSTITTEFTDGEMVNRLNSEVIHILNQCKNLEKGIFNFNNDSFDRLNGFEFNHGSLVRNIFHVRPELEVTGNQLKINIPEMRLPQEFNFPKEIDQCMMSFGLGMFDLTNGQHYFNPIQSTEIEYQYQAKVITPQQFKFEIEPGCLCVIVISLQFLRNTFAGKMFYNTIDFNPTAILKAFISDGKAVKTKAINWQKMDFKAG
ncbi:MAG: hypothetical protein WC623_07930 [Pedobacter sp.]|uniref:hypothetical protein n=1 Tax=Pedobacter sp. TaxID=1411316 RepID=UPI003563A570